LDSTYKDLIAAIFPTGTLEYFDIVKTTTDTTGLSVYLEERNVLPQEFKEKSYHSKGFYPEVRIQDFPIRGKKVYLCIKRRRWEDPLTGEIYSRDWKLVQSGTKLTAEFAAFLKGVFG
jgi:hypothetical protein